MLAAEITARPGRDPGELYRELTREFGDPAYERVEAPATPAQKQRLAQLSRAADPVGGAGGRDDRAHAHRGAGERRADRRRQGSSANGWFAARPSGTEDIYKIYAESFRGAEHLARIVEEAQAIVDAALAAPGRRSNPTRDGANQ